MPALIFNKGGHYEAGYPELITFYTFDLAREVSVWGKLDIKPKTFGNHVQVMSPWEEVALGPFPFLLHMARLTGLCATKIAVGILEAT